VQIGISAILRFSLRYRPFSRLDSCKCSAQERYSFMPRDRKKLSRRIPETSKGLLF